ncbi:MAG: hypothetical protein ACRCZF_10870 [Gemmataceae bacterium]
MLQIRAEQFQPFVPLADHAANEELIPYARARFPSVFSETDDETVRSALAEARLSARKYGIEREDNVATFFDFTIMYGSDFPQQDWAADILTCDALHGPDKMAVLRHRVEESGVSLSGEDPS